MIFIYSFLFIIFLILFYITRNEKIEEEKKMSAVEKKFYQAGSFLERYFFKNLSNKNERLKAVGKEFFKSSQVKKDIRFLYPTKNISKYVTTYYKQKIMQILIFFFCANLVCIGIYTSSYINKSILDGRNIIRNDYGQGDKNVEVTAFIGEEKRQHDVLLEISERQYEEEEINIIFEKILRQLETDILGNNESLENVRENLMLMTNFAEFPITITWECDDYTLMNSDGEIVKTDIDKKGELLRLRAILSYKHLQREHEFYVKIFPKVKSAWEQTIINLEEIIQNENKSSITKEVFSLPKYIHTQAVTFKDKRQENSIWVFMLALISGILIYKGKDKDLHKEVEKRRLQMMKEYPDFISKITLLLEAGMTMRRAFYKLAEDYKKEKQIQCRYLYEEVIFTCREMESGVSELKAYENFGQRCNTQQYMKFAALITQNVKKGASGLLVLLKYEAKDAFEERKALARRLGEEAGTKLLLPMMIMLAIVMIVIIVPAFLSFQI